MITIGTNLAILGSISSTISALIIEVEISHQKIKFKMYLNPDLE
jgi:hypothetical protein